ncbi:MAG: DUF559 domain-containing protein [Pseudonocardia sp.]
MRAAWRRKRPDYTPPSCKTCSTPITGRTKYRAVYCSKECKFADPEMRLKMGAPRRRVTKVCPHCDTDFSVSVSTADRYTYCSRVCSNAARGRDAACERCGAAFRRSRTEVRRHCSETCRRPAVTIDCGHCGTGFRVVPSAAARKRYCSIRCYRAGGAETGIERRVREVLENLRYPHRAQAQIGPWVVDFLVEERLVIEADGTYWHSLRPDVDRRKTADITDRGYTVWRLPEVGINLPGFPANLQRRLADYEVAHGEIARVAPGESVAGADEDRVVPRQAKRAAAGKHHPAQLLLDL